MKTLGLRWDGLAEVTPAGGLLTLIGDSRGPVRQMAGAPVAAMCRIAGSQATASHGALAPRRPMHGSSRPKRVLVVTTVPGITDQG